MKNEDMKKSPLEWGMPVECPHCKQIKGFVIGAELMIVFYRCTSCGKQFEKKLAV